MLLFFLLPYEFDLKNLLKDLCVTEVSSSSAWPDYCLVILAEDLICSVFFISLQLY